MRQPKVKGSSITETEAWIVQAAELIRQAHYPIFFTGAGMSKESGIPTFRDSLDGHWSRYRQEDLATPEAFAADPVRVREFYESRRDVLRQCRPNTGHLTIAKLEETISYVVVITQNVDGLHGLAGSSRVFPLHGNIMEDRCHAGCADVYPAGQHGAFCPGCGLESLRPNVVWFGEPLDEEVMLRATAAVLSCDLFLSIGTSGLVYPAAGIVELALQRQIPVIEINPEETPFSKDSDFIFRLPAAEALPRLCSFFQQSV